MNRKVVCSLWLGCFACFAACLEVKVEKQIENQTDDNTICINDSTAANELCFSGEPISLDVGERPQNVVIKDLNRDSIPDIVTTNIGSDDVSVLLGVEDGTFLPQKRFPAGFRPDDIVLEDFDQNGVVDILVTSYSARKLTVLLGSEESDGTFLPPNTFSAGDNSTPFSAATGDLDLDGTPDLVTSNAGLVQLGMFLGYGDGTFQDQVPLGGEPVFIALEDVNQDDILDIVTSNRGTKDVSVFLGVGDGTFSSLNTFPVGGEDPRLVLEDVNQDDILDIVTSNRGTKDVSVLLGAGDGTFSSPNTFLGGDAGNSSSLVLGDLNKDGAMDIITLNRANSEEKDGVSVLLGEGDGTFVPVQDLFGIRAPLSLALTDLNGDSFPDLVVVLPNGSDSFGNTVTNNKVTIFLSKR